MAEVHARAARQPDREPPAGPAGPAPARRGARRGGRVPRPRPGRDRLHLGRHRVGQPGRARHGRGGAARPASEAVAVVLGRRAPGGARVGPGRRRGSARERARARRSTSAACSTSTRWPARSRPRHHARRRDDGQQRDRRRRSRSARSSTPCAGARRRPSSSPTPCRPRPSSTWPASPRARTWCRSARTRSVARWDGCARRAAAGRARRRASTAGGQERERRSGTQDVAGAVGLATALRAGRGRADEAAARVAALRDRLADGLLAAVPGAHRTVPAGVDVLPGHLHLCLPGVEREELLVALGPRGSASRAARRAPAARSSRATSSPPWASSRRWRPVRSGSRSGTARPMPTWTAPSRSSPPPWPPRLRPWHRPAAGLTGVGRWHTGPMRVLVAMSGGVDSSVAAALLVEQGHDVVGATLKLWGGPSDSGCCSVADVDDARRVAQQLGHRPPRLQPDRGVRPPRRGALCRGARRGRTPNPCIECNRSIKFDRLLRPGRPPGLRPPGHRPPRPGRPATSAAPAAAARRRRGQGPVLRALHAGPGRPGPRRVPGGGDDQGRGAGPGPAPRPAHRGQARQPGRLLHRQRRGPPGVPGRAHRAPPGRRRGRRRREAGGHGRGRRAGHGRPAPRHGARDATAQRRYVTHVDVAARRVTVGSAADVLRSSVVLRRARRSPGSTAARTAARVPWRRCSAHGRPRARAPRRRACRRPTPAAPCEVRFDAPQRPVAPGQTVALYDASTPTPCRRGHRRLTMAPSAAPRRRAAEARERVDELRALIAHHNELYHMLDAPEIPDAEYDLLVARAAPARGGPPRAGHGRLADASTVGAAPSGLFQEVRHRVPMMSLDNAFDEDELRAWAERLRRQAPDLDLRVAGLLLRAQGRRRGHVADLRARAASCRRPPAGDGVAGEDVTANVATVKDVPKELAKAGGPYPEVLEVRGEIYMPRGRVRGDERAPGATPGERLFVNPRNSAAGALRQKDPASPPRGRCTSGPTRSASSRAPPAKSRWPAGHADRARWPSWPGPGFPVSPDARQVKGMAAVVARCRELAEERHDLRLRDRRRGDQGRRPGAARRARRHVAGARAGPSPSSSRPRSARRGCSTSWSPSGAPAGRRPSPASSRSSSAARRSAWPRCTTRTRWRRRTCARATWSSCARRAT